MWDVTLGAVGGLFSIVSEILNIGEATGNDLNDIDKVFVALLAKIAKADGIVTTKTINVVKDILQRLESEEIANGQSKEIAIQQFNEAKKVFAHGGKQVKW